MDAERIWTGDEPEEETKRRLLGGYEVFSHNGVFVARMDTTGMVREMLVDDPDRTHVVDYASVSEYIESLNEWNTPNRVERGFILSRQDDAGNTPTGG